MMKNKNIFNFLLAGAILLSAGCTVNDADDRPVEFTPKFGTATINIVNAIDETDDAGYVNGIDIWVDEVKLGAGMRGGDMITVEHEFPQGTIFRAVIGDQPPRYLTNPVASYETVEASATAAELLPADHNDPLQGQLKDGGSYTLITQGFVNTAHGNESINFVEDDLTAPSGGNAKVRFINAAGTTCLALSCSADFVVGGTTLGSSIWGGPNYWGPGNTGFTDFVEVPGGNVAIDVMDPDPAYAPDIFSGSVDVAAGGIYTIIFLGDSFSTSTTEQPFRFQLLQHN